MWLVTGATGHVGNVLIRKLLERGEKVRALILPGESRESIHGLNVFDLAKFAALFTPMYYRFTDATPRFTPYSLEVLQSNSNISHAKATLELGYKPRAIYESIHDAIKWFLEKKK